MSIPIYQEYQVMWAIDLYATSPKEAAEEALKCMRDPESIATFFTVIEAQTGKAVDIDLMDGGK